MGASQRHKCEIHNFTVIGDGSCPPYSQAAGGGPSPGPEPDAIMWNRPPPMTLQLGEPMPATNMNMYIAEGGRPIIFGPSSGDPLPPGLTLSSSGVLSGTPSVAGTYGVVVIAQNSVGAVPSPAFRIIVA